MPDASFAAWVNLDALRVELELVAGGLVPGDFTSFAAGMEATAEDAEAKYRGYLTGHPIPGKGALKRPTGGLARGVYRRQDALLQWALGNASDHAKAVEEGAPERDMKKSLATAPRARKAKDGSLYLIIPFRHGVSTASRLAPMPKAVHAMAVQMAHSRVVSQKTRVSATGHTVPAWIYEWNGRLTKQQLQDAGMDDATVKRYQGLVRMGKPKQTTYMTFRVMSQKSKGWIRPAQPGLAPLQTAIDVAWTTNKPALEEALQADLESLLLG
jgi:hypothetical protein